ncbi:hypothetical protein DH2020_009084 [Rehmannia glutinosa]|uniref:Cation-chloride cotransporter 1 n=1 Tax=Rehmannia glutinosa TaxID=99300 RepID=A0ABR0X5A0_REHGL
MAAENNGAEIEAVDENEFSSGRGLGGRKYRPVFAHDHDRAVLEMSSIDPSAGASSSVSINGPNDLKKVKVDTRLNEGSDGSLPNHRSVNGSQTESKLELFGFDSLVNILGLKSMAGDQIQAPSSPRDGDDAPINIERPQLQIRLGLIGLVDEKVCERWIEAGEKNDIILKGLVIRTNGITGLSLESFKDNWSSEYQTTNNAGIPDPNGKIYWNFNALVGLFFPAVTGIMAGSNRSASLKDTQRSIPIGTLAATLTTTGLYLVTVLFFGALATRDKLLTDRLLTATVAWPVPAITYIGIILSTLGAALQSLTGAPRLLAAIANDDILPVLNYFKVADGSEPHVATLFTAFLCIGCVVIGNLDLITPTVTMFYLLCYGGVNLSCFLLDLLDAPSWRPRWKFHHWSLSLVGALICIVIMFLISWTFTVVSLALATLIYYYVSIKGKAGDWGDGFKSAYFQLALRSLRSLGASQVHPKNWYPIPLIFCRPWGKLPENVPCHPKLADFANFMKKKGRGMSIFVSILDGDYHECAEDAKAACRALSTYIEYKRCEGVAEIVVAPTMSDGFRGIVQTMGLGNLKPNIVVMRYPEIWRRENLTEIPATFVGIINDCIVANKAVVIVKGLDEWPNEYQRQYGTIDLYWIVRDGGLMLLLSQLLLTKESFESCKIQVFCIAEEDSDAEELKADVKKFLYDLRMQAEVIVISMKSWDAKAEQQDESVEAFTGAQERISRYLDGMKERAQREGTPFMADGKAVVVNEQQVEKFLFTTLKLNSTILKYSRMAAVVLVSLPPPPLNHPAYFYMEYMDLLVENVPRLLMVRGYRRDVVTLFT